MTAGSDNLTKVHIDLPNHWWFKGESLWAKSLGNDLYEIQNIPFCAYGLNCRDVVLATADAPDLKPEIRSVVRHSGNKTVRVFFADEVLKDQQQPYLEKMQSIGAWFERAKPSVVCINVEPATDYELFCKHLVQLESDGILEYETCEERISGSFDDLPESEQDG